MGRCYRKCYDHDVQQSYVTVRKAEFPMSYPFEVPIKWIKNARRTLPSTKQFLCFYYCDHKYDPDWNAKGNFYNWGYTFKVVILGIRPPYQEAVKEEKPKHPPGPTAEERFEKIKESFQQSIDNIFDKSPVIRVHSIRKLTNIMIHNFLPSEFLSNHSNQLLNQIKRLLRNGSKPIEKELASIMLPVFLLQLPSSFNLDSNHKHQLQQHLHQNDVPSLIENLNKDLNALLLAIIKNTTNSCDIRGKCCIAITMLKFLENLSENDDEIFQLMEIFEKIIFEAITPNNIQNDNESDFSLSSLSETALHFNVNDSSLISTILNCWAILLTLIPPNNNFITTNSIDLFIKLLGCSNLNVRLITGKIIALLYETFAIKFDDNEDDENNDSILMKYLPEIMDIVEYLASERNKYKTKRDLNKQHKVFRDIKQFLLDGTYRKILKINYGNEVSLDYGREFVKINSWLLHFRYGFLCKSIGSGITVHLMNGNQFVRDILELGDIHEHPKLFCGQNKNFRRYRRAIKRIDRTVGRKEDRNMKNSFDCV